MLLNVGIIILAVMRASLMREYFSSWYALILLLLYVRGVIVLFMYFSAIIPNQKFNIFNFVGVWVLGGHWFRGHSGYQEFVLNNDDSEVFAPTALIDGPYVWLYLTVIIFLFATLMAAVKITTWESLPLRIIEYYVFIWTKNQPLTKNP